MKNRLFRRIGALGLALLLILSLFGGCTTQDAVDIGFAIVDEVLGDELYGGEDHEAAPDSSPDAIPEPTPEPIDEYGWYSSPEDVAEYIHTYGRLPDNFLTKSEAQELGWVSSEGNLWEVAEGMSIGGDRFGNREGLLPDADGRKWYECDLNYSGGYRGAERIVFSNDGLIYYTGDHYESFTQLY